MPARGRNQALTVVLPALAGFTEPLASLLAASAGAVREKFARVPSLHFARFALLGPNELLFETTFDGTPAAHLAELWREAGPELSVIFSQCAGFRAPGNLEDFTRLLEHGARASAALFTAHDGLRVERVRADARVRADLAHFLDAHDAELRALTPFEVMSRAQAKLALAAPPVMAPRLRSPHDAPSVLAPRAWARLALTWVGAVFHDVLDALRDLWLDTRREPEHPAEPPPGPLGVQRCFSHVARLKPGRFRRATLKLALRTLEATFHSLTATGRAAGARSIHAARWVLLEDGRLVFLCNHDGSFGAALGAFALRASGMVSMIWSQTLGFPASFGWLLGGARSEARLRAFAAAGELATPLWYSAYPELAASEVSDNAEIRALLAGELDARGAERVLALVRD